MKIIKKDRSVAAVTYHETVLGAVYEAGSLYYLRINCGLVNLHTNELLTEEDVNARSKQFRKVKAQMVVS